MNQQETRGGQSLSRHNPDANANSVPLVRITPNRHSIDNRFPILGFSVVTSGLPYFEVLLTVDRSLFAPHHAGRRNGGNFYASRQDSGLVHATGTESIYLVPPAVLRSFAQQQPPPRAIYYTLVAYRDASGNGPVFAHRPDDLPNAAPSVAVAGDFTGQTLATVLGIPADKLKYVTNGKHSASEQHSDLNGTGLIADTASHNQWGHMGDAGTSLDDQADMAEGEDGYAGAQETEQSEPDVAETDVAANPMWSAPYTDDAPYSRNGHANETTYASATVDHNFGHNEFAYEDGYEEYGAMADVSAAQDSTFPTGAIEPEPLSDEEQPYGDDLGDDSEVYAHEESEEEMGEDDESVAYNLADDAFASFAEDSHIDTPESHLSPYEALSNNGVSPTPDDSNYESYEDEASEAQAHNTQVALDREEDFDEEAFVYQTLDNGGPESQPAPPARQPLSIEVKRRIIEYIARFESGRDGYSAINPDGEFEGRFGTNHPAYQRYHIGLSYGAIQFTQDSGLLGRLLTMMQNRDGQTFTAIFGQQAEELLRVTTAEGPPSRRVPGGRSARVQPVGGTDVWREPWVSRFRRAGQHVPFQAAQNELAALSFLDPMLQFAGWLGLDTDRALAMVVDRAVQLGRSGAQRWIISAVGPVQTSAQQQQALAALGLRDLQALQRSRSLPANGEFTPLTHAALVAALRDLGARSPLPIPTREQMLDAMVRHASGRRWAHRLQRLRQATEFTDTAYQL